MYFYSGRIPLKNEDTRVGRFSVLVTGTAFEISHRELLLNIPKYVKFILVLEEKGSIVFEQVNIVK